MKRSLAANSPPPNGGSSTGPLKKKQRPSVPASSSNLARSGSNRGGTPYASASSPPFYAADSPATQRQRSRSRSLSVVPGQGGPKGKEREADETAQGGSADAQGLDQDGDPEVDGEDEEIEYSDDEFGMNQKENARQKQHLRVLMEHFDPVQMDRYEAFRRSGLTKSAVRKLVNQVLQQSVSPTILTVVRGFAKVFVGEIVEKARSIANHDGPLTPADLREAHRLYIAEHEAAGAGSTGKKMFVR
ncbi:transcription initiation factor TFIID subunit 11, partial [Phenoliferia sp. Uapishka_3]